MPCTVKTCSNSDCEGRIGLHAQCGLHGALLAVTCKPAEIHKADRSPEFAILHALVPPVNRFAAH